MGRCETDSIGHRGRLQEKFNDFPLERLLRNFERICSRNQINFLRCRIVNKGLLKLIRGSKWWHRVRGMALYDLELIGSKYSLVYFAHLSFLSEVLSSSTTQKISRSETQRVLCWSQLQPDLKAWKLLIWRKVKNWFFGCFMNSQAFGICNFKRCNLL